MEKDASLGGSGASASGMQRGNDNMASRVYWLWLATRNGVGPRVTAQLLEHFGDPEAVYAAGRGALLLCGGLTAAQVDALSDKSLDGADRILETCAKKDYHILTLGDSNYPDRLRHIYDPPVVLYWRGQQPLWDTRPMLSIVGTRNASAYGLMMAERFAYSLAESGFLVVSGMADGVDGAANRGALRAPCRAGSIAVLGCGVDICYPIRNAHLFGDLLVGGTLLSEFPPGSEPAGWHFPQRNRIISGLSLATIVIEAPLNSGALITARLALDQGRDVYAAPDRLGESRSAGCNALIRDHEADLLTDPVQLVRAYGGMLREIPDEAKIDRAFRSLTGRPAQDAEPVAKDAEPKHAQKKGKPDLWRQIDEREARGDRRRKASAAKPPHPEQTAPDVQRPAQPAPEPSKAGLPPLPEGLSEQERRVLKAVRAGARSTDQLIAATGYPAPQLLSIVTMLELDALLRNEGGMISLCE